MSANEIESLNFDKLLGGPLSAAVNAQVQAAMATVAFVKDVGFQRSQGGNLQGVMQAAQFGGGGTAGMGMQALGEPIFINFDYQKTLPDGRNALCRMSVPFLCMLPIPSLRIESCNIEFLARINSTTSYSNANSSSQMSGSYAYQANHKDGGNVSRTFSLGVKIKAVSDEIPAGMDRVLGILESIIKEQIIAVKENEKTGPPEIPK